jgi:hypothetical protein
MVMPAAEVSQRQKTRGNGSLMFSLAAVSLIC